MSQRDLFSAQRKLATAGDWGLWKLHLEQRLQYKDPGCLEAITPFPNGPVEPGAPDAPAPSATEKPLWAKACAIIMSSLAPEIQAIFVGQTEPIDNPRKLVQQLRDHFFQNNDVNLLHAEDEFMSIQKSATESVAAYSARITMAATRVISLGGSVEDRHRIARFRKGLQHLPEWKPWADNQNQNSVGPLAARLTKYSQVVESATAFAFGLQYEAEINGTDGQTFTATNSARLTCGRCKKNGHTAEKCWATLTKSDITGHGPPRNADRNKSKTRTGSGQPPSPCRGCGGNHWRRDCPKNDGDSTAFFAGQSVHPPSFVLDSGSAYHICRDRSLMVTAAKANCHVSGIGGQRVKVEAIGTLENFPGKAQHVPESQENILSISELCNHGWTCNFDATGRATLTTSEGRQMVGTRITDTPGLQGLYRLDSTCLIATSGELGAASMLEKHRAFGHIGERRLRAAAKMYNIDTSNWPSQLPPCKACLEGKGTRAPVSHAYTPVRNPDLKPGQRLHIDFIGPMFKTREYILDCTDEASRYEMAIPVTHKSNAPIAQAKLIDDNYGPRQHPPDEIHSDQAAEFTGAPWREMCRERGIRPSYSAPYTPAHNGIAERNHGATIVVARALLADSGLNPENPVFAKAAYKLAVLIHNITPHRALDGRTPYEIWHGAPARIANMLPFGTPVLYFSKSKAKFGKRRIPGLWMGPDHETTGGAARIYCKESKAIITTRDFKVDTPGLHTTAASAPVPLPETPQDDFDDSASEDEGISVTPATARPRVTIVEPTPTPVPTGKSAAARKQLQVDMNVDYHTPLLPEGRRTTRGAIQRAQAEGEYTNGDNFTFLVLSEPNTYKQAMTREDAADWKDAMQAEAAGLLNREAFEIVPAQPGQSPIRSRWVFKAKTDENNTHARYKARLVACGYAQIAGIDYFTVSAPVAAKESIRTVFALAAQQQLKLRQFDFNQAYVNADLDTDVYMLPPDGLLDVLSPTLDDTQRQLLESGRAVLHLKKALYGLKQSGRLWYETLRDTLVAIGFKPTETDPCVFVHADGSIIVIHVDDGIIAAQTDEIADRVITQLQQHFTVKDLGVPKHFVGWTIDHKTDGSILLHQQGYSQSMGHTYAAGQPLKTTPLLAGGEPDLTGPPGDQKIYAEMIGSALYATISTRPDASFAVSFLSRFMQNPTKSHVKMARNVIAYLAGTAEYGLHYKRADQLTMTVYCDASFATSTEDSRKSRSGYLVCIGDTPVVWKSALQPLIAFSTAEAEYIAMSDATRDAMYIRQLLSELGFKIDSPITVFEDNQTAKHMAEEIATKRSKHIDLRYHYVRHQVAAQRISIEYCPTDSQLADALTKALPRDSFCRLRDRFMAKGEC